MLFRTPGLLNFTETHLRLRMTKATDLARNGERGTSAIEWVIISAVLIVLVGIVATVLINKITTKAATLDLDGNGP